MHRIGLDVHPPMYYIFLRFWHYAFGDSMWSLRGFSALFGILTVFAVWLLVKEAFKSEKMAFWAAFLAALSPFQAEYVTEARMYTMGAFFAVLSAYFLVKALHDQKLLAADDRLHIPNLPQDIKLKRMMRLNYLGYAVSTAVIILTHYYLLFTAAAIGLYGLVYAVFHFRHDIKKYAELFAAYILIGLAFLPWLKVFLFQYRQVGAGYWIPKTTFWSIPDTLWTMLLNFTHDVNNHTTQKLLLLVALFSIYFLIEFLRKTQQFEKWLVVLALLAPFGGAFLFEVLARMKGSTSSVYQVRYFLFASTFYTIALAAWLSQIKTKAIGITLLGLYAITNVTAIYNYWHQLNVSSRPGMNAAAKYLGANVEPGQHVFLGTSFEFFNYKYYAQTYYKIPTRPQLYTGGRAQASQMSHVEGSAILADFDLVPDFQQATTNSDTVWLVWTYAFGSNKPETPKNWVQISEKEYPDVRPYVGTSIYVTEYRVN